MIKGKYLLPLVLCLFLAGCAPLIIFGVGTAAGIGGYKWYEGKLAVIYQASFVDTWDATLKVIEHMNMLVEKKNHDLTAGNINARRADRKPVTISLAYKSEKETEAGIRVGIFGDRSASMAIKEEIRKELFKE